MNVDLQGFSHGTEPRIHTLIIKHLMNSSSTDLRLQWTDETEHLDRKMSAHLMNLDFSCNMQIKFWSTV